MKVGCMNGWPHRTRRTLPQTGMLLALFLVSYQQPAIAELPRADGYRGIWYMNQPSNDEYRYKYSGGFATYPQQHLPIAIYVAAANKTFFCYGGTTDADNRPGQRSLLHMVSYYDHATGTVPRPAILLDKKTDDAHDNPTLAIDAAGHLWIFSNAHGTSRPAWIHRSKQPYSIDDFEQVVETNFSYGQPWHFADRGFLFLHTRYAQGRRLFFATSTDGRQWSEPQPLSYFGQGHYQVSWRDGQRLATAFNYHPAEGGLNYRTNLYYLETRDHGATWQNAAGELLTVPLDKVHNPALVHDFESEGWLVYMKDLQFDAQGRPVILFLTSRKYVAGPAGDPRIWRIAHWQGDQWTVRGVIESDHNYDFGSLYLEADGTWRLIAPTTTTAEPYNTGGEIVMWTSRDEGRTWRRENQLTRNSLRDHGYARRPLDAHPDFYALWADGRAREPSASSLYFTNRAGDHVWRLPTTMTTDTARPEIVE